MRTLRPYARREFLRHLSTRRGDVKPHLSLDISKFLIPHGKFPALDLHVFNREIATLKSELFPLRVSCTVRLRI